MSSRPSAEPSPANGRGKAIRVITVYEPERVIELSLQQFGDVWVPYKRVVYTIH